MNIADYLLEAKDENRVALLGSDRAWTYGELDVYANQFATQLLELGILRGDRVILLAENSAFWVAAYLGTLRVGAVAVPLATGIRSEDLAYILENASPSCAFVDNKAATRVSGTLRSLPQIRDSASLPSAKPIATRTEGSDLAALMFTSGSTGRPRGVMVTHDNVIANTDAILSSTGLCENDRVMQVLPFHYCFGTSLLHTHLRTGASVVIDNRFLYPEVVLQRMIETRCTGFAGVPSHFQILLRKSSLPRRQLPDLRWIQQAGGHLAPQFVSDLQRALPSVKIFIMYGQTEATARLTVLPPECLHAKKGSIGRAVPGVELTLVDQSGVPVRQGQVGEIVASGRNVTLGYWRDPEESAACFRGGKLFTGDLARMDAEGFFYIVGRAKEFLKCGGKRISCRELEDAILECEEVLEAAVLGMADEVLGEAVRAFVVPRSKQPDFAERVGEHCKHRLNFAFQPKEIVVLNSLPKNSSGKVLKHELK